MFFIVYSNPMNIKDSYSHIIIQNMASQKVTFNEVIYLDDIMYDLVDDECNFIFCDIQETCQISSKDAALKLG